MAGDTATELLFIDTFKHQSAELTNIDVVRFPCGVLITEVRVIPPGIKAHSSLPDSRAFGETSPHAFQLELFFNNVAKPSPCFHRLGSLEYDENKSIVFRPSGKVNTDGLVLRGWYTSLTLAVYGTAERAHGYDHGSPPPPPPPPPQQQSGAKRAIKQEWDTDDQYNGSPPRPAPRGPRTPPGPPPPDDDEEEQPVPAPVGPVKAEPAESRGDFLEAVSPERSLPVEEPYSEPEGEEPEEEEPEEEEEEDARTEGSVPEEEEEEDEGEDEEEEMEEGDDGYEQISSDEDDLDNGSFKLPSFDMDYTPEDLASVPPVQYDPYERELRPLIFFTPPYKTRFETQLEKASAEEAREPDSMEPSAGGEEAAEAVTQLKELLMAIGEDRDSRWVTALEQAAGLLAKGLGFLIGQGEGQWEEPIANFVQWALQGLSMDIAITQPIALNLRQLKAGAKLASYLAECPQGLTALLRAGALGQLLELLHVAHVSSSLKLSILKALDALTNAPAGVEAFLHAGEGEKSGYQCLVQLFLREETVRVVTAGNAILQKSHVYEVLVDLQQTATVWSEPQQEETDDADSPIEEEPSLSPSPVSEAELDRLAGVLEELHHLLETAPHTMVQPPGKAFPTTVRITGPQERDDPYPTLYRYMLACCFLESTTVVLSTGVASGHLGVAQAARELLRLLSLTQPGLLFMMAQPAPTNLLLRVLASAADTEAAAEEWGGEGHLAGPALGEDGFGAWLMQALHALQGVSELMGHVAAGGEGAAGLEDGDNAEVLGTLHALYLITFTQTGRSAVAHALGLDNNMSCLLTLLQHHGKDGQGETKARKAVTYNYACMLVLVVVQSSSDLSMMEQYATPLLTLAKADDTNAKLQELSKWLEPLEKLQFEISSIPTLIDYVKQNVENVLTPEGAGLVTALRVLCHIACPPPAVEGQQKDLKWSLAGVQLFSAEGLDTCVRVLQKLCGVLLQPWRVHGPVGPTPAQRCVVLSVCAGALQLLRTMLTELLRGGAFQFRDARVASVLVHLHMVVCSVPASGRLDGEEVRVQGLIVDVLLTFTQGVSEQATHTEETLASNTWCLMLKEVLGALMKAPEGLFSGLTLLSELLPLPLPMHSTQAVSVDDMAVALNTRKLWSMHVRAQWKVFAEALKCVCGTACPPLLAMLRRVCVQLADLSATTATLIMKSLLELVLEELQPAEGKAVGWGQALRLLSMLDALVSQRACKGAVLHLLSGSPPGEDQLAELFPSLLALLAPPTDHAPQQQQQQQQQCSELVATVLQSLCDQDISLVASPPGDGCVAEAEQLANSLPCRELMSSVCGSFLEVLGTPESSPPLLLTCIRTLMFLTEHDYGLYHIKCALKKHGSALFSLFKRLASAFNKDSAELLAALLDFLRQVLSAESMVCCGEEGQGAGEEPGFVPAPRSVTLTGSEMKALLQWEVSDTHPLTALQKQISKLSKEDDTLETMLDNVVYLRQSFDNATDVLPAADTEPSLPGPETLLAQFNHRTVFILSEVLDEQLKALWFSPFHADDMDAELDMVKVDLMGLAQQCCPGLDLKAELERSFLSEPSSPGHTKTPKGFRLGKHKHETFITSGKSDYVEPAKRAHIMAAPRGRGGRGGFGQGLCRPHDIFRQRKQNTSRPPSMHVDDFVAAEFKDIATPLGLLPPKRPPKTSPKPPTRGLFTGNRGRATFHSQTRFFTPPQPKGVLLSAGNYPRREGGGRGSSWSAQLQAVTHRGTYSEPRGGQSNFTRGPLPSRQPPAGAYRLAPRDRAPRGRGGTGLSWLSAGGGGGGQGGGGGGGGGQGGGGGGGGGGQGGGQGGGGGGGQGGGGGAGGRGSQGSKFSGGGGGGGGRGRHVRSFTR
ncbi:protein virilizer homolog isoform X4 [Gadus morhua]|uniref:Vir like m6A methyltransferase associated n=1 Tax=Gadus morhua TaxID=8049 RepID=A0A8C5BCM0_GADMO|nr:protein virilizer homolog isoform X4 [Gadus morhua]